MHGDADKSAKRFEERLLQFLHKFISRKVMSDENSAHQWLDETCRQLIWERLEIWGTEFFKEKRDACTNGLLEAYYAFIRRTRAKQSSLKL